ncbi:MAG: glycosyltransferase family 2 protein [Verrucomicrobia bacterium]|nr:glycosyltransferase family 2 protein [Verrucomicrobiota bacterium]
MAPPDGITVYTLSFNEARQIRQVLQTVQWADELLLLDSFSTDGTVEIARELGARVLSEKFCGFGKLRNQAVAAARHDWILSIDADERCTPELAAEIRRELAAPRCDAYLVPRKNFFCGRRIRHCGWYPDYRQPQLFHRAKMRYREDLVHEGYELQGRLGRLREHVLQYPWPTLAVATGKLDRYATLMAQRYAASHHRATAANLIGSPLAMFLKMYVLQQGFRDGRPGLVLCGLYAYYTFLKYARLWELQQAAAPGQPDR